MEALNEDTCCRSTGVGQPVVDDAHLQMRTLASSGLLAFSQLWNSSNPKFDPQCEFRFTLEIHIMQSETS